MNSRLGIALTTGLLLAATLTRSGWAAQAPADAGIVRTPLSPTGEDGTSPGPTLPFPGGSRVVEDNLYSPTLDLHTTYRIMLPPGYDSSSLRYPVLYMLHGVAGDSNEWQSLGLLDAADRMIQRGEIDPFLIVPLGRLRGRRRRQADRPRLPHGSLPERARHRRSLDGR